MEKIKQSKHPKIDELMKRFGDQTICEKCGGNTFLQLIGDETCRICKDCGYSNCK